MTVPILAFVIGQIQLLLGSFPWVRKFVYFLFIFPSSSL